MSVLAMFLLGRALAQDPAAPADPCERPTDALIQAVRDQGEANAGTCLALRDDAGGALLAALAAGGTGREALLEALAMYRLQRLDVAIPDAELRAFGPAQRRLLRDGVYARRGRRTPAAAHARIFERFAWYKPDPAFTNGRLTPGDRENLTRLDSPPPPQPEPEPASAAMAEAATAPETPPGRCGCSATPGEAGVPLVGLALARRRRRGW